jgi:lipoprotein-releasing system permease protein
MLLERLFITRYMLSRTRGSVVRTIAILSVGGIGLGVMAMVVILSVMQGFDEAIKSRLLGVQPHVVVAGSSPEVYKKLLQIVGHKGTVDPFATQDVIIRTLDGIFSGGVARGMETQTLKRVTHQVQHKVEVMEGGSSVVVSKKQTNKVNFELGPKEVALGLDLARSLGIFEGDEINVVAPESLLLPTGEMPIYEKVKVRALLRTDVPDIDTHAVFYDVDRGLKKLRAAASLETGFEIRLENPDDSIDLKTKIQKAGIKNVKTWQELHSALFYSLRMEKSLMGIFLALTILVSSFSVVAVLVLLVTEKRADVGILKSIGATKVQIRKIFLAIGIFLGLIGIGGGVVCGLVICGFLERYPIIKLPEIYYDTTIPVQIEYTVIGGIVLLGILLTLAGAVIPAWRIADTQPIEAIRHDNA